ncbi:ATP-dependent helicase [Mycolicibacterium litorale]|uniref:DNA 3'-5' helicase n=1 Tax=Mycolicibacterium litorale TaxID=758802 RepID=A0AAD1MU31_9MYCO|nr:ATP-dependent DNA helicase [Mycolicibacterium litorale]MCV7415952.1 ATP-dependent helicase [Mycolicibacterium litorale]TDY09205.1 DNA helicase-2/ATP-dependent DNA helicase PcrA [Mycolicibacterium litorale]BBY17145.1 ATP-dependent DNA helicase [Mycolicibacterium litorale]
MTDRYSPAELASALGLFAPTDEQAAVIAAPPGPVVVIAGAGAGKTETMAARVVWLVANGYATPGQVLGLTFTRKAAGQLLRRVRTRLARLAGAGLVPAGAAGSDAVDDPPTVSTYHAFAGTLLREHGLLLPIEPETRLITATEMWQLAHRVVCEHPGPLEIDKTPAVVTSMVLRLAGQLAEHLVDTDELRDTHVELERLVHTLPAGPHQRDRGPSQWLLRMLATQTERTELIPLIDALHRRMQDEKVMDFGMQMAAAARLAAAFPQVGVQLRERYRVVLLDEYQDTGHAQRVALSALFGGGVDDALALTAVGDPIQSIYGWRGASATNLPRFATDFPRSDGSPAPTLELRTSWRNPPSTLHLANAVSAEARQRSVAVRSLRPRPGAEPGTIRLALLNDVALERDWVADAVADRYHAARAEGQPPPTAAVLLRRNADAAPMADALTARGVPVEVVGLAGLLGITEVADVVAMLRLVADPTAGAAAVRTVTGPRWRLGGRDIAALWRRAVDIDGAGSAGPDATAAQIVARAAPDADAACLADAICDPGPAERYSAEGYRRIVALGRELTSLRGHLGLPLPDLVAEVRRVLGVDAEARAGMPVAAGWSGTEHLDAFVDVVADYASRPGATIDGLLAYLDAAVEVENGLAPAELAVSTERVQILTVHAAKGLEWQVVAVPHLSGRIFPSTAQTRTWLSDPAELPPLLRGDRATTTDHGVPVLDSSDVNDRKMLGDRINDHKRHLEQRRVDEERRLLYVALTRAEDTLLLSGHHWGGTEGKPRGPSEFLEELKGIIEQADQDGQPCGVVEQWAPPPPDGERNPLRDNVKEVLWPADPAGDRRAVVDRGAELVARAMADPTVTAEDVDGWAADVDALLAERERAAQKTPLTLPNEVSVSTLVDLSTDPDAVLSRLNRRVPARPDPHASLGTAFHDWVQRYFGAERLFDLDDLPGAVDSDTRRVEAEQLTELQTSFMVSPWAARTPLDVEVPFDMVIGETMVRGRIDAVFADDDGGATVVDWKTGAPPDNPAAAQHAAIQLAVYRLAWAALSGCPVERVRAAFHYVRSGRTVRPADLPDVDHLAALLRGPQPAGQEAR